VVILGGMANRPDRPLSTEPADLPYESISETAGRRGRDDRRGAVNPAESPAPHSPPLEENALREGEEKLDRVKPY
jgi:hypothetical protein